jgi:hypothetical protein
MEILTPKNRSLMLDALEITNKRCVEVGVFEAEYSKEIIARNPKELYLIDPWLHQSIEVYPDDHSNRIKHDFNSIYNYVCSKFSEDKRVTIIRGYSFFEASKFENESLDFVYIDAIHTFESCLCDVVSWYPKVRPGGWLCGHDYTGKFLGVKCAVDAFCRIANKEINLLTQEYWASWGIKK